jgi:hypothetical protein
VNAFALAVSLSEPPASIGMFSRASLSGIHQELTRSAGHDPSGGRDKEAWYMAWIVVVPPSPRRPHEHYQACYQEGKRQRWPRSGRSSAAVMSSSRTTR